MHSWVCSMSKYKNTFIKNIYHMLAYAFQSLKQEQYKDIAMEEFDNIHNLMAAILAKGIGYQLKQGLYREYVDKKEDLPVLRGKINLAGTIRKQIARKQLLNCEFDELSENNLLNQIIKSVATLLLKHGEVDGKYKNMLKKELLYFGQVDMVELRCIKWDCIRYGRNNKNYHMLLGICRLVAEGMLLTTEEGQHRLATFVEEKRISTLYERFLLAYYRRKFPQLKVNAKRIDWNVDGGYGELLPVMQSDVMLEGTDNRVLIIDAKFYSHIMLKQYDVEKLRSTHLYQIFAYVKNKEYELEGQPHEVSGMLLYAGTEGEIQPDVVYQMHGNRISVKTLNLNLPFREIAKQLKGIVWDHFPDIQKS